MDCIEEIFPYVLNVGSIPEGQDGVFFVDRQGGFDFHNIFLNDMGLDGLGVVITSFAAPHVRVLVSPHLQRVEEGKLMLIGKSKNEAGESCQNQKSKRSHSKLIISCWS